MMKARLWLPVICCLLTVACRKDTYITSSQAQLYTSASSIAFDTVFTSVGSVTQSFKIINLNDQKLLLSKVALLGGNHSSFKININGINSTEADNLTLDAGDSLYVFVSVTINPSSELLPFLINDSILIRYNGNDKYIPLQAYGQNAHFLQNHVIVGNEQWTDTLPYIILGGLQINNGASLVIPAGTRIYVHADAPILVDGTLIVTGTATDSVLFTGDRLDQDYAGLPGSWLGIYFRDSSTSNILTHAVILNASQGIVADSAAMNGQPKLVMHQCIISNASDAGILCHNSSLDADNTLISNCANNIQLVNGGIYHFTNCTIAAYGNKLVAHQAPAVQVSNSLPADNTTAHALNAVFQNCIIWGGNGNVSGEITAGKSPAAVFALTFDHCLYKTAGVIPDVTFLSGIENQDPDFDLVNGDRMLYDFHTTSTTAPGIDQGVATAFPEDLDDSARIAGTGTDLGCFEKQ